MSKQTIPPPLRGANLQHPLRASVSRDGTYAMAVLRGEHIVGANAAFDDLLGPLPGSERPRFSDLVVEDDAARVARSLRHALRDGHHTLHLTFRARRADRNPTDCGLHWMRTGSLDDNLAVVIAYDPSVLDRYAAHDQPYLAFHDPDTGLVTEAALLERLCRMWHEELRETRRFALILLDVTGGVPDTEAPGAAKLDSVPALTGKRLATSVREYDCVARRADGSFAVLIPQLGEFEDAPAVAARLVAALEQPVERDGVRYAVHACAGVAVYPDRASTVQTLFATADAALRRARESGQSICSDPVPAHNAAPYRFRLLAWQDAYACGVDVLDEQHRDLLERINDLANELLILKEGSGLLEAYEGLVAAATHHFQTEEALLGNSNRSLSGRHADQHTKLLADLKALRDELPKRRLCLTLAYLSNWLLQHVVGSDQRLAAALRDSTPEARQA